MWLSLCLRDPWDCLDSLAVDYAWVFLRSGVCSRLTSLLSHNNWPFGWNLSSFFIILLISSCDCLWSFFILVVPFFLSSVILGIVWIPQQSQYVSGLRRSGVCSRLTSLLS